MNVYEAISARKSVRRFTDEDVSEEIMTRLLKAAMLAPSVRNMQEWRFVQAQPFVADAPVLLVGCAADTSHLMLCGQPSYPIDVAIAIEHVALCAVAEGLGTCWIGHFEEQPVKAIALTGMEPALFS